VAGGAEDLEYKRCSSTGTSDNFTIIEGTTSEIQRMIIGRAVTGLDVRKP
jgi:hypothetical protein